MRSPITEQDTLKATLESHGLRPNKALGQNFFTDAERLAAIADAADIAGKNVVEIGPGPGALTELLTGRAKRVIAVEKDAAMSAILTERLGEETNLSVVTADALRFDPCAAFGGEPFCVAGNLPYYITTPISERYVAMEPESLTLMVQREAAARFLAQPGDRVYGPLAVVCSVYYRAEKIMDIPRGSYWPQPEVDSAVVQLVCRPPEGGAGKARAFFAFLNRIFAMRRKTLINNLGRTEAARDAIAACGLPADVRAEAVSPGILYRLFTLTAGR